MQAAGSYSADELDDIWRELKPIFAEIQGNGKCGFCETKLARRGSGGADGDVEHYRPKGGVTDWPTMHDIPTGGNAETYYYWLTYEPRNYLLACRVCNQDFKQNFFPIAGVRCQPNTADEDELRAEHPYLLHPLDPKEPDPEDLIEFLGIVPRPRVPAPHPDYWRAVVTIEILGFTEGRRLDLDLERAQEIVSIYLALQIGAVDPVAERVLQNLDNNATPHRNCARSFMRLCEADLAAAKRIALAALDAVRSI